MPLPIMLLMQLASAIPALAKFMGAGDATVKITEQAVGIAQAVTGVTSPEDAVARVLADPVKMQEFQLKANEQMITWEQIYLADMQDARKRDADLAKAGYRNWRAHALVLSAYAMIIICFIAVLFSTLDDYQKTTVALILGRMLGYIDQAYNFEFGTTRSSQQKDTTITNLTGPK